MSSPGRIYIYRTLHEKGIPYCTNHVRRLIDRGLFPEPDFYMGERTPAWTELTLDLWIETQQAAHARGEDAEVQAARSEAARAAALSERREAARARARQQRQEALAGTSGEKRHAP